MANDITSYRMFGLDYYDAIMLSGEYQVQQIRDLEKIRDLSAKDVVKVGIPYMDEMAKRLKAAPAAYCPAGAVLGEKFDLSEIRRQNPGGTFADRLSYYRAAASAVLYFGKGNDRKTDAGLSRI